LQISFRLPETKAYLSCYLDHETAKGPFRSSSQVVTIQFNHSKVYRQSYVPYPSTQQVVDQIVYHFTAF